MLESSDIGENVFACVFDLKRKHFKIDVIKSIADQIL